MASIISIIINDKWSNILLLSLSPLMTIFNNVWRIYDPMYDLYFMCTRISTTYDVHPRWRTTLLERRKLTSCVCAIIGGPFHSVFGRSWCRICLVGLVGDLRRELSLSCSLCEPFDMSEEYGWDENDYFYFFNLCVFIIIKSFIIISDQIFTTKTDHQHWILSS